MKCFSAWESRKIKPLSRYLQNGSISVEIYRPQNIDGQTPHMQDELYVIINGSGKFMLNGKFTIFQGGDVIFVPAGEPHCFIDFTENFSTWVIFYGPDGGEDMARK